MVIAPLAESAVPSASRRRRMASMWRQAMLYLGLGPDEQYDELDGLQHQAETPRAVASKSDQVSVVTSPTSSPTMPDQGQGSVAESAALTSSGSVRTIPITSAKPHVVAPRTFNDAQQLADRFKADQPVIVNLQLSLIHISEPTRPY